MSHFTVLHIGYSMEEDFAPYNEQDDNYCKHIDNTEDFVNDYEHHKNNEDFAKHLQENGLENNIINFGKWWHGLKDNRITSDPHNLPKGHCMLVGKDGNFLKDFSFYNPNAKWDWYTTGGRWSNLLLTKSGEKVNSCGVKELDIETMLENIKANRKKEYNEVIKAMGGIPVLTSWQDFCKKIDAKELTIEEARDLYHGQEAWAKWNKNVTNHVWKMVKKADLSDVELMKEIKSVTELPSDASQGWVVKKGNCYYRWSQNIESIGWGDKVEDFACTEQEYIDQAELPFYALNIEGDWVSSGEMGWWGMDTKNMTPQEWQAKLFEHINEMRNRDDAEYIICTLVDCHI